MYLLFNLCMGAVVIGGFVSPRSILASMAIGKYQIWHTGFDTTLVKHGGGGS